MAMHPSVAKHLNEIREVSARYGIEKLEIFGSAMTPAFDPERSDVDFIVHYPPNYDYGLFLEKFLNFEEDLSELLGRKTHIMMTSVLRRKSFRQNASTTRTTIYVASGSDSGTVGHQEVQPAHP